MNFIFEWWKQYFTNEHSEWVKYCFSPRENKIHMFKPTCLFLPIYIHTKKGWTVIQSEFILCEKENLAADVTIDLFSLYVLFSHFTSRDGSPENCQIPSYTRASRYILVLQDLWKDKRKMPWRTSRGLIWQDNAFKLKGLMSCTSYIAHKK